MLAHMKKTACLLVGLLLVGCGKSFVRKKGRGLRRVIAAERSVVYKKALAQFADLTRHKITERNGSIYVHNKAGFLHMAFHFYELPDPKKTEVEMIARTWLFTRGEEHQHEKKVLDYLELNFVPGGPEFLARMKSGDTEAQMRFQRAHGLPVLIEEKAPTVTSSVDKGMDAQPNRPNDFAVVVGIENYQNAPPAEWASRDAKTVATYFKALGVPEKNIVSLAGPRATRAGIAGVLEEWLPKNTNERSRVYFYFSGHGAPEATSRNAYILPWDGDPAYLKTSAYSLDRLYAKLAKLPARESVVLLDACFSGSGGRSVIAKGTRPLISVREAAPKSRKLAVLSASAASEIAGGLDEQGHGLFTYYLLDGLQGNADPGKDGKLSLSELHSYVSGHVMEMARRQNREQSPRLRGEGSLTLY